MASGCNKFRSVLDALGVQLLCAGLEQRVVSHDGVAVRGVVATRAIPKGAAIATAPLRSCFYGPAAAPLLRRLQAAANPSGNPSAADVVALVSSTARRLPRGIAPLTSRDALLTTMCLAALHLRPTMAGQAEATTVAPLARWVAHMPPRLPPLGEVLKRALDKGEQHTHRTVTPAMLRAFYEGRKLLEPRGRADTDASVDASFEKATAMNRALIADVVPLLTPLLRRVVGAPQQPCDIQCCDEALADALLWAHFMLRSRCVNLAVASQGAVPAVVPFLDLLNHSSINANVGYVTQAGGAESSGNLTVVTTRKVSADEQLTMNYGDFRQRLVLFGDAPHDDAAAADESLEQLPQRLRNRAQVERDVQRIHDEMRFVQLDRGIDPVRAAAAEGRSLQGAAGKASHALDVAEWVFAFGFAKSQEEMSFEASCLWDVTLAERIARLTDVRRRGRPGEFVVGVPEGLKALQLERQALQLRRYGGQHAVFPPVNRRDGVAPS